MDYTDIFGIPRREYISSPFNYTGSKFNLLNQIVPHLSKANTFLDLFCGGGSVFINLSNIDYPKIIANDKIPPLIDFYKELQTKPWEFIQRELQLRKISKSSQEDYFALKERYNTNKNPYDFFILVCSCTNNMLRFNSSGGFNQTWGQRTYNNTIKAKLKKYWDVLYQNSKISFQNKDWFDVEISEDSFVYLDPPYFITGGGYNTLWSEKQEIKLYEYLLDISKRNIKFAMSNVITHKGKQNERLVEFLNDGEYNVEELSYNYNKVGRDNEISDTKEVLVTNYVLSR